MSNRKQNARKTTAAAQLERLEDRQYRSGNHDIGINVNDSSSAGFAKSLPVLKSLGVTSVRLWYGVSDFNTDRSINGGLQRAIDYHNAGYDVTMTIAIDDAKVPDPAAVKSWFKWAAGNDALRNAVDRWEIGNEVDSSNYFQGSLKQYVEDFLKPASESLHAVGEKVVSAGVSWNPEDVKTMIGYGMLDMVDAVGFHPYAQGVKLQKQRIQELQDVVGGDKPLIATEWNVRGYEGDKTAWAQAVHDAYGNVHAGFDLDYYYCLYTVDTKAGPSGLMNRNGSLNTAFYKAFLTASQGVASTPPSTGNDGGDTGGNTPSGSDTQIALYDADTDRVLSGYTNLKSGQVIDLSSLPKHKLAIVVVPTSGAKSVKMNLNGTTAVQSAAPYAFFGDDNGDLYGKDLAAGSYSFSVTPYSKTGAKGTAYASRTISFKVQNGGTTPPVSDDEPSVTSYSLVNAKTGQIISGYSNITASETIQTSSLGTTALALIANVDDDTQSVMLTGPAGTHAENTLPYAFFGDDHGKYATWTPSQGTYDFSAVAYGGKNAKGAKGGALSLSLKFV